MIGGDMTRGVRTHGPSDVGERPAARRHESAAPPHEAAVRRWGGKRRLPRPQDWPRNVWPLQTLGLAWGGGVTARRG